MFDLHRFEQVVQPLQASLWERCREAVTEIKRLRLDNERLKMENMKLNQRNEQLLVAYGEKK